MLFRVQAVLTDHLQPALVLQQKCRLHFQRERKQMPVVKVHWGSQWPIQDSRFCLVDPTSWVGSFPLKLHRKPCGNGRIRSKLLCGNRIQLASSVRELVLFCFCFKRCSFNPSLSKLGEQQRAGSAEPSSGLFHLHPKDCLLPKGASKALTHSHLKFTWRASGHS